MDDIEEEKHAEEVVSLYKALKLHRCKNAEKEQKNPKLGSKVEVKSSGRKVYNGFKNIDLSESLAKMNISELKPIAAPEEGINLSSQNVADLSRDATKRMARLKAAKFDSKVKRMKKAQK